ncbi:MAG: endonuclease III [Burkholderiales bacterium]|nr:endonuclease III [Burkholderiales bacterium]
MNREKRIEILKILQAVMPKVTTELEHKTPFELLVAVMLSAQATDKSVNEATRKIFPEANTPEEILKFGPERFLDCIKHVGLYKGKTKNVMKVCEILRDQYDSKVPEDIEALQKLPGVGKKTASVVMNVAFDAPFIGVDTHVFRVANRTGYAPGKTPLQVQIKMEKYTPAQYKPRAHQWFLRIGRYICKARIPECWRCPIERLCEYKEKVLVKPEPKKSKTAQLLEGEQKDLKNT